MELEKEKTIPQGAIWVKNFKLRQSIGNFISTKSVECPKCRNHFQDRLNEVQEEELNEVIVNHVMTVKLKVLREKFIAIYNPRKSLSTHPDYFLYVYQAHTGAPSVYPFSNTISSTTQGNSGLAQGISRTEADKNMATGI